MHTSGSRWRSLLATVEFSQDLGLGRAAVPEAVRWRSGLMPPGPGGAASPGGVEHRTFQVTAAGVDEVRIEQTGEQHTVAVVRPDGTATMGPDGEWGFQPSVLSGSPGPVLVGGPHGGHQAFGVMTMVEPWVLLRSCRFDAAEQVLSNGRTFAALGGRAAAGCAGLRTVRHGSSIRDAAAST